VPLIEKAKKIEEDISIPQTLEEEIEKETIIREPLTLPIEAIEVTTSEPKEERQHRYLQSLLKHIAQEQGYRAVIEEPTSDGGRVDVGLEQDGIRIACEISVTSTSEQEIGNIEKCLRAGYDQIVGKNKNSCFRAI